MSNEKQVVETLRDLSWKKFKDLSDLLNVDSMDFGWKSLMATFDFYNPQHVSTFNREKNPAESVLFDLKSRMLRVDDLYIHLHQMGHKEAMNVIVDCGECGRTCSRPLPASWRRRLSWLTVIARPVANHNDQMMVSFAKSRLLCVLCCCWRM